LTDGGGPGAVWNEGALCRSEDGVASGRRRRYLARRVAALALLLCACRAHRDAPPALAFGPPAKIEARPLVEPDPAATVKLLDPGGEPRRVLRYHPAAAAVQRLEMDSHSTATNMPLISERLHQAADVRVEEVLPDGVRVSEKVTASEMASGAGQFVADRERRMFARLVGRRVERVLDQRGRVRSTLGVNGDSLVGEYVVPLPEEPVGAGARWTAAGAYRRQGMAMEGDATFELVAADGDRLTLRVTRQSHAPAQRMGGEAAMSMEHGEGGGTLDVDLGRVLPLRDEEAMKLNVRVGAPGAMLGLNMSARFKMREL
jgi:hypothetical protein